MSKVLIVKNKDKRIQFIHDYLKIRLNINEIEDKVQLLTEVENNDFDYVILPIRGVNNDFVIDGTDIKLTENYLMKLKNKKIFTGIISEDFKNLCDKHQIDLVSYFTDDLAIKNNYITTEGVIETIVNNSEKAIFSSNILIIGYGRLGQINANVLKSMKADITVVARDHKDIVHGKICDLKMINYQQMLNDITKFDFIINTVPYKIIDNFVLDKLIDKDILIIDVASEPYGLNHQYAFKENIKTILLPGIPGKIAPQTSGKLIAEFIYQNIYGGEY